MKSLKKKPIQIYIEPEQDSLLEMLAKKKGVSKASIIRSGLDKFFSELPVNEDPLMGLIGLGGSGRRDLSEMHDRYLAENTKSRKE